MIINKIAILFFFYFCNIVSMSAQENNFYLVRHLINKAEIAIVNNEYKIALEAYDSAFSLENGKFIFFRDYFNAAKLSLLLKREESCIKNLRKLITIGYSIQNCKKDSDFIHLLKSKNDAEIYSMLKLPQNFTSSNNLKTVSIIDSLCYWDQKFRKLQNELSIYKDSIKYFDINNFFKFKIIIENYNLPKEIGVNDIRQLEKYYLIVYHYFQRRSYENNLEDFTKYFQKFVYDGSLSPYSYAALISVQGSDIYGETAVYKINNGIKLYGIKYSPKKLNEIDLNRASLGLESIDEYKRKVLFSIKNQRFDFSYRNSIMNMQINMTEEYFLFNNKNFFLLSY